MPSINRLRQRLYNQHVAGTQLARPEDVVRLLGAVQSQDYPGAKWSLGQRVKGATDASVDEAFNAGRFLRTHVLRPTWHFVSPEDIRWMLELTAPHVHSRNAYSYRELELEGRTFSRCHTLFERALEGGAQLTRSELAAVLKRGGIVAEGRRLAYIMMQAELERLVCSGALKGKRHTYALLDERAPAARRLQRGEALAALAARFFRGHGPATLKHFAWWSELPMKDARTALEMVRGALDCEVAEGLEWFGTPDAPARRGSASAYLVPEYDEALTGYADLGAPDLPRAKGRARWSDSFFRPVIIGARRAGTWRRTIDGKRVTVEANLFAQLDAAQTRALQAAAERFGRYLDMQAHLQKN